MTAVWYNSERCAAWRHARQSEGSGDASCDTKLRRRTFHLDHRYSRYCGQLYHLDHRYSRYCGQLYHLDHRYSRYCGQLYPFRSQVQQVLQTALPI